ncbi:hypothetical protein Bca4012_002490 [Brassica carinata]
MGDEKMHWFFGVRRRCASRNHGDDVVKHGGTVSAILHIITMASEQARRENVVKQREVKVEKDKGRDSGVHVTHAATERGSHGGGEAAAVFGQEGPGRVGVELTGEGREELESGAHGFHGEKARHAQLLAAGGEEIRERKGQVSVRGGRSATETVTEKGRQDKESVGKDAQKAADMGKAAKDTASEKA